MDRPQSGDRGRASRRRRQPALDAPLDAGRAVQRDQHRGGPRRHPELLFQQRVSERDLRLDPIRGTLGHPGGSSLRGPPGQAGVRAQRVCARPGEYEGCSGGQPHYARTQAIRCPRPASPRASRSSTTWVFSPRSRPPSRIPTATKTARTCCSIWTKPAAIPSTLGFGAELARIGGGVTTFDASGGNHGFQRRASRRASAG